MVLSANCSLLLRLPTEIRDHILDFLRPVDLSRLNLANKACYDISIHFLWREVELKDCRKWHEEFQGRPDMIDDHDDRPLIRKLVLLATRPSLAVCVQTLTHRCHLPPPAIFQELPQTQFDSQTLSTDPRTIKLVRLAARNMKNVRTLRIICGHPTLTDALLRCFFDMARKCDTEYAVIQKLWLENCRVNVGLDQDLPEDPYGLPQHLDFSGLERVRFRRLPIRLGTAYDDVPDRQLFAYSRGTNRVVMCNGAGGQYWTATRDSRQESSYGDEHIEWLDDQAQRGDDAESPLETFYKQAHGFDDLTYDALAATAMLPPEIIELGNLSHCDRARIAYRGNWLDPDDLQNAPKKPEWKKMQREKQSSFASAYHMLHSVGNSLTSLTFDWVQTVPIKAGGLNESHFMYDWLSWMPLMFQCRFPHLRAFQMRNCVVAETVLPRGLYLLDRSYPDMEGSPAAPGQYTDSETDVMFLAPLRFMEAHPKLQCLAWPLDHFFAPRRSLSTEIARRVNTVLENLARSLVDLRLDMLYTGTHEPQSEESVCFSKDSRSSRRRFITDFAARMHNVESIKIEGGVPRDERREIVRALRCPLKKIVMIGVSCPLGNTWGADGNDLDARMRSHLLHGGSLEGEDKDAVWTIGTSKPPATASEGHTFEPQWGWHGQPPMIYTVASYHADTVREVKFCGYKGSSILLSPTAITTPMLAALKHFHKLESIIMSMELYPYYDGRARDAEVIEYWRNSRSPNSTAVVFELTDDEPEGWELELRTKYSPEALAWHVTNLVGKHISEEAKGRKSEGVHVRASFCLGQYGGIFDLDVWVGKGAVRSDVVRAFRGPREELEAERRREKLEGRRWF